MQNNPITPDPTECDVLEEEKPNYPKISTYPPEGEHFLQTLAQIALNPLLDLLPTALGRVFRQGFPKVILS